MFGWWRRRRQAPGIPDAAWQQVLASYPFLAGRPAGDLAHLRALAARFLETKEFHGASGLEITDDIALSIAAQAVLPVLHLDLGWYDDFVTVVVQPDEVVARRTEVDEDGVVHAWEEVITGEAMPGGPVMLSWHDVSRSGESAQSGYNVVIHEFAHKIDLRDGHADGCPPLPSAQRRQWLQVLEAQWQDFRERVIIAERFGGEPTWMDPYGAQSIDEFFAVACEAYFVNRARFSVEHGELLALFDGFFLKRAAAP